MVFTAVTLLHDDDAGQVDWVVNWHTQLARLGVQCVNFGQQFLLFYCFELHVTDALTDAV